MSIDSARLVNLGMYLRYLDVAVSGMWVVRRGCGFGVVVVGGE